MLKIKAERLKRVDLNPCVSFGVGYKIKWQISEYLLFFIFQCPVWMSCLAREFDSHR